MAQLEAVMPGAPYHCSASGSLSSYRRGSKSSNGLSGVWCFRSIHYSDTSGDGEQRVALVSRELPSMENNPVIREMEGQRAVYSERLCAEVGRTGIGGQGCCALE